MRGRTRLEWVEIEAQAERALQRDGGRSAQLFDQAIGSLPAFAFAAAFLLRVFTALSAACEV